ncbi:putative ribonuclease H-like domain-containing protein [Tanacetum coccineum]
MVPRAVLMKSGLVSINTARQNISKTAVLVNTARQVNAAHSKTTVNAARPMSYLSKTTHSTVKRPIHKNTAFKNSNINQRVNTVRGKKFNTARPKAVVNAVKGNNFNAVKALACWDETSGILKSFITGIENLVDHKVKVIRCDNRTEFKNKEMNQFCEMKGILRQFSVARTPQQNGVAERRNRTLIEASLGMLADSKLSTTFLDHLGKFDGKADEGFFIGYSLNSKAFRVFNGTQSSVTGTPVKNYILLPLWTADLPYSQDPKSSHDDGSKPSSDDGKKVDEDPRKDSECKDQEKEDNVNSTNTVNAAGTNEVNDVGGKTSIELPFDPNMSALEDYSIFDYSSNDKDDGAEDDMNNLDTTIQVNPILTTRIHKDHPLDQVIGDLQSATQTRKMSKNLEEHGFEEPKKVIHALKDPSWIEAMQEELLQFKLQEVWTLVDLPNRKRAIGSKWVFRNKNDERLSNFQIVEEVDVCPSKKI